MTARTFDVVGRQTRRLDGVAKVTGQEVYSSDVTLPNMLYAVVVRSPYAHAVIEHVDTSEAEAMGAVCLTYDDVPKVVYNERIVSIPEKTYRDRTVLPNRVRHVGEVVVGVAAETEALALAAARKVRVAYTRLPEVLTVDDALAEKGGARLYDEVFLGDTVVPVTRNIACERTIREGDVEAGFQEADVVVESEFDTQRVYHAQMETKSAVCRPEPDGGITVWTTTQSIHNTRQLLGRIYGLPLHKVNVVRVSLGGAFGSSIQMNTVTPICVGLALKARRPVKLVSTREEDMHSHHKYAVRFHLKVGAKKDGRLVAAHMKAWIDAGGHNTQAYPLLGCIAGWFVSLYKWGNLAYDGLAVYTNKVSCCAMQGYGNPQTNFAVESLMDMLAEKLGMDPIALRRMNYVGRGDEFWGQGPSVRSIIRSCGVDEMLTRGAEMIGWDQRMAPESKTGDIVRGIGLARGFHTSGTGGPKPGEVIDYSSATLKLNEDGSVDIITAVMDHGGGTWEAAAKVVAETLMLPLEMVSLAPSDTRTTGYDVCTHATRGIYCGVGAVHHVALQLKEKLLEKAALLLEQNPRDLTLARNDALGQAVIYPTGLPENFVTVGEIAKTLQVKSMGTIAATDSYRQKNCPPCFVTHFVEVEVNKRTGAVRVTKAALLGDCGTPINPDLVEGQLIGALYRGIGYTLLEEVPYDSRTGDMACRGYINDARLPTAAEMPLAEDIHVGFADTYEPSGPLGAKGIGEAAQNSVAAAITNAIHNATGIRFLELPVTPEKVLEALRERAAL